MSATRLSRLAGFLSLYARYFRIYAIIDRVARFLIGAWKPGGIMGVVGDDSEALLRVRDQIKDALELSNYVVATGIKDSSGNPLPFADVEAVQKAAVAFGLLNVGSAGAPEKLTADQWVAFAKAYYNLSIATSPVTAETLRNTAATSADDGKSPAASAQGFLRWARDVLTGFSPAQRFTRGLLATTIIFVVCIVAMETLSNWLGMRTDAEKVKVWRDLFQSLVPWAYGGLGACASLLRSAHTYIYQRSFDLRRKPEYTNRILLGAISGGAIILFTEYLIAQEDSYTHFGSAAFGFIAGYSTDFLFNTIERIVTAIFPKVQMEMVANNDAKPKPAKPAVPTPVDLTPAEDGADDPKPVVKDPPGDGKS